MFVAGRDGATAKVPGISNAYPLPTSEPRTTAANLGRIRMLDGSGRTATYEAIYRSQPWVYAVVNKQVYGLARLPLKTYVLGDADERERADRGNDLDRLLRRPYPRGSGWHLKVHIAWDLLIHGHSALLKSGRPGAPPDELWPLPWRTVKVITDESGIIGYEIRLPNGEYRVDPGLVVHYSLPGGVSPLEPLRRTLAVEDAAYTWQGENFANGVTPRGAFVTEQRLNDQSVPRLREELAGLYAGPENAGRFGLFDQGLKFDKMGVSAADAELINQRKLNREEVCGAYDMPPTAVGILERATFSNITELRKQVFVDTLGPKAILIESTTNVQLVDPVPAWDGYFVEFDMDGVLRPEPEARARTYLMSQQSSTTTVNERRRLENLPPIGDPTDPDNVANQVLMPANMIPTGHYADPAAAPPVTQPPGSTADSLRDALVTEALRGGAPAPGDPVRTVPDEEA